VAKPKKNTRRAAPTSVQENGFSSLVAKGEYGPTNSGDSLWKVAKKVNQHNDVSIEQIFHHWAN
jgi:Tfp pilus assembly protein FimV